jgi:hypothetical protein
LKPMPESSSLQVLLYAMVDSTLRRDYLVSRIRSDESLTLLATDLDRLCADAERGVAQARTVMPSFVLAVNLAGTERTSELSRVAKREGLLALDRVLGTPRLIASEFDDTKVPDYGKGRVLTLGERKTLASRPDRKSLDRLLLDPHPAVIAKLLQNPRLTEDDVVRLASRKPAVPVILAEVAASPRFIRSSRVKRALCANPTCPELLANRVLPLLAVADLQLVLDSPSVAPAIRAMTAEYLARKSPQATERTVEH